MIGEVQQRCTSLHRVPMFQYTLRRIVLVIPTILAVVTLVFFLFRLVPGDTARLIAGEAATEQDLQQIRIQL